MTTKEPIAVCAVRAADNGARLLLEIAHGRGSDARRETLCVFAARQAHLPVRGVITPDTYADFVREAAICEAMTLGLRLLAYSGVSQARLREKLRQRGVCAEAARTAVALLASEGYLDETESALAAAKRGLAKLWGDRRILADLAAKGFASEALQAAKEMLASEDSTARCVRLIEKQRMCLPQDDVAAARFAAVLTRYGYTSQQMKAALEILEENEN